MKIYGDLGSGNCLKVKYTADQLRLAVHLGAGRHHEGRNPHARVPGAASRWPAYPAVELADGRRLAESNAIIRYLARGSALLPDDAFAQAKIDEWLFWEQYSHEPYVAATRFHMVYLGRPKEAREPWRVERGEAALDLMDRSLAGRRLARRRDDDRLRTSRCCRTRGWRTRAASTCRRAATSAPGSGAARTHWVWARRTVDGD